MERDQHLSKMSVQREKQRVKVLRCAALEYQKTKDRRAGWGYLWQLGQINDHKPEEREGD